MSSLLWQGSMVMWVEGTWGNDDVNVVDGGGGGVSGDSDDIVPYCCCC